MALYYIGLYIDYILGIDLYNNFVQNIYEGVAQSCSSKLLLLAASPESCSKLLPKAVPRRCSPKLCSKAVLQSYCSKAAILQTCSPKRLPKAIPQSNSRVQAKEASTVCAVEGGCSKRAVSQVCQKEHRDNSAQARQAKAIAIARSGLGRT